MYFLHPCSTILMSQEIEHGTIHKKKGPFGALFNYSILRLVINIVVRCRHELIHIIELTAGV